MHASLDYCHFLFICNTINDKCCLNCCPSQVYLFGGHVTSWKNEHGEELLFVSSKVLVSSLFVSVYYL